MTELDIALVLLLPVAFLAGYLFALRWRFRSPFTFGDGAVVESEPEPESSRHRHRRSKLLRDTGATRIYQCTMDNCNDRIFVKVLDNGKEAPA